MLFVRTLHPNAIRRTTAFTHVIVAVFAYPRDRQEGHTADRSEKYIVAFQLYQGTSQYKPDGMSTYDGWMINGSTAVKERSSGNQLHPLAHVALSVQIDDFVSVECQQRKRIELSQREHCTKGSL